MIIIRKISVFLFFLIHSTESLKSQESLIFFDDFSNSSIDLNYWNYELGDGCPELCGWGNLESQIYTKNNILIENNKLIIKATKEDQTYFSGRLNTKGKIEFQYGIVEVRAKLPKGKGVWPAIWMLGFDIDETPWPACGEIDIMEYVGKNPSEIHTTVHTSDSYGNSKNTKVINLKNIENGFHIYSIDWNANRINFLIDNNIVYRFSPDTKTDEIWPFDKPFYLILNLAIGGRFGGFEIDDSIFPQEFIIDYVKVYKRN